MMKTKNRSAFFGLAAWALAATLACTASSAAQAQSYQLLDLGYLGGGPGGFFSQATGINAQGQVVGISSAFDNGASRQYGFVWNAGSMSPLLPLGNTGFTSYTGGINNAGQIAGTSYTAGQAAVHTVRWQLGNSASTDLGTGLAFSFGNAINNSGVIGGHENNQAARWSASNTKQLLPSLGGSQGFVYGLNDAGLAVGESLTTADVTSRATLWNAAGQASDLGTLAGGSFSWATGINSAGHVVGASDLNGNPNISHATLWRNGQVLDLGTLGGQYSDARAINTGGLVVGGSYLAGDTVQHAMLWNGSTLLDLNALVNAAGAGFAYLEVATALNDSGQIVGNGITLNGQTHAFLLTPVPEPQTWLLMFCGLAGLAMLRRRQAS